MTVFPKELLVFSERELPGAGPSQGEERGTNITAESLRPSVARARESGDVFRRRNPEKKSSAIALCRARKIWRAAGFRRGRAAATVLVGRSETGGLEHGQCRSEDREPA